MNQDDSGRNEIPKWSYVISLAASILIGVCLFALLAPDRQSVAELLPPVVVDNATVLLAIGLSLQVLSASIQIRAVLKRRKAISPDRHVGKGALRPSLVFTILALAVVGVTACWRWFPENRSDDSGLWRTWVTVTSATSMCDDRQRISALEQFHLNLASSPRIREVISPVSLGRQYIELGLRVASWADAFSSSRPVLTPGLSTGRRETGGPLNGCRLMRFYLAIRGAEPPRRISGTKVAYTMPDALREVVKSAVPATWPPEMQISALHREVAYVEIDLKAAVNGSNRAATPIEVLTDELSFTPSVDRLTVESLVSLAVEKVDAKTGMLVPLNREQMAGSRTGFAVEDLERSPQARVLIDDGITFVIRADIPAVDPVTRSRYDLHLIDSYLASIIDKYPGAVTIHLYAPSSE